MYAVSKVVFNGSKILIRKQITTCIHYVCGKQSCFQWFKDTNSKANHNLTRDTFRIRLRCFQWFKDTNSKANHNFYNGLEIGTEVVFNGSKILIRKQITTFRNILAKKWRCFQWFKDTNLKANHNTLQHLSLKR